MKLWYSFTKELKLSSKSYYFYIEIVLAFIFLFVLMFVIPDNFESKHDEYLSTDMPDYAYQFIIDDVLPEDMDGKGEEVIMKLRGEEVVATMYETDESRLYFLPDRETMLQLTEDDRPYIGAHITWDETIYNYNYEYILQGYESEKIENFLYVFHNRDVQEMKEIADTQPMVTIGIYDGLSDKENMIPSFLAFNGSLMGMFIIAAFIFLDKKEGIVKAYAVTASSIWQYLMSKVLVLIIVTLASSLIIVIPVMKLEANYPLLILLLVTSGFFASAFGLLLSSFFKGMNQSFGALYVAVIVFLLPNIAYFVASWEPLWIKLIPTYPLLQGFKETIVQNGDTTYTLLASLGFLLVGTVLFIYANYRFKKTLCV